MKYIDKNIYKFLDSEENELYLNIIQTPDSQEYDDIMKMYNDLIKDDKMKNKMEMMIMVEMMMEQILKIEKGLDYYH